MIASLFLLAAALQRALDPYTCILQTDDAREGAALSSERGYWPVPHGLVDPLAAKPEPRIVHACFRVSETPFAGYDPAKPSPLFKVNQVGYLPGAPKFAYAGAWLGPGFGPWKPRAPMDSFELVRVAADGAEETVLKGKPVFRVPDGRTKEGVPFTGEETYEMDFSSVSEPGTYFVRIPGVGRSASFRISPSAAEEAFRVHMLGLYQKRCGIAKTEPFTHWTAGACHSGVVRGTFAPDEGELSEKVKWFDIIRDNTDWKGGERLSLPGGWHDAADYDRRPQHLNIVNDLCAVYLMRPGNFYDGQLSIPENSTGIPSLFSSFSPKLLDEAEWGLRHLLAGQEKGGGVGTWIESTGHPGPGNMAERDDMPYALSRATRRSSLMYAAHASLLARCHPKFREKYLDSAKRAWDFAVGTPPQEEDFEVKKTHGRLFKRTETKIVHWREDKDLPVAYLVKAAVNLNALTGEDKYLAPVLADVKGAAESLAKISWNLIPLLYAGERELGLPASFAPVFKKWETSKMNAAKGILGQVESAYAYRAPWWPPQTGWVHAMGFGHSHPLVRAQYLVAAHQITGDKRYLDAISLANDFHNGCNRAGSATSTPWRFSTCRRTWTASPSTSPA